MGGRWEESKQNLNARDVVLVKEELTTTTTAPWSRVKTVKSERLKWR